MDTPLPKEVYSLSNQIVAGIDIHKDFLHVTVLRSKDKFQKEYGTQYKELHKLKRWLARLKVVKVAVEATGIYMTLFCDLFKERFEIYLVNASRVRMIPGKKTDALDSAWLALLLQKDLLSKSYIPPVSWRETRELVRQRLSQTQTMTRVKNRLHKVLLQEGFYLSSVFTDICGNTSLLVIEELSNQKTIKEILMMHGKDRYIKRAEAKLLEFLPNCKRLSHSIALLLKLLMNELEQGKQRIAILEHQVDHFTQKVMGKSRQLKILQSIPGFGTNTARSVLSEIGEISRFPSGKHFVSYAGLSPGNHESGGKSLKKSITKRGNKYLRTLFVEAAHSAARTKQSKLRKFFIRKRRVIGTKKAIVALAAKLMRIVHAILTKDEYYVELDFIKDERLLRLPHAKQVFSLNELYKLLRNRGLRITANFQRMGHQKGCSDNYVILFS